MKRDIREFNGMLCFGKATACFGTYCMMYFSQTETEHDTDNWYTIRFCSLGLVRIIFVFLGYCLSLSCIGC